MANGGEYVTWEYMKNHEDVANEQINRINEIEAEIMGDERTGRLSLRMDVERKVNKLNSNLKRAMWIIIALMIAKWIADYTPLNDKLHGEQHTINKEQEK